MRKSIREHFDLTNPYHSVCREERNLCAVLYHLLLSNPENLPRFLKAIGRDPAKLKDAEIYVEYAHLRDIWYAFGKRTQREEKNRIRREFILDALDLQSRDDLRSCDVQEFNKLFVGRKSPSSEEIESPSNWSIRQIDKGFPDGSNESDLFLQATRFKWCFNVKPDIVIFLSQNEAISIEAKLESSEGKYPSGGDEWKRFQRRGLHKVPQTAIQKQVFELLGINAHHVILAKKSRSEDQFAWEEVFRGLDLGQEPEFLREQLDSFLGRR